jgi:hypothetical protein
MMAECKPIIYLYDLPKVLVTSDKIKDIIREACGYEMPEPCQFKHELKFCIDSGLPLPLINAIIKVD